MGTAGSASSWPPSEAPRAGAPTGSGQTADAYRPVIAVAAYHLGNDRVARWPGGGYGVPAPYIEALRRAGARTAIIAPGDVVPADDVLEPYDGLVLVGGGDVDPARYGANPDTAHLYGIEPDRDASEIDLVRAAERLRMPTLCICRGMQVMNVAYGGTLHQHLPDRHGLIEHGVPLEGTETLHPVTPEARSHLAAVTKTGGDISCSSHHHQGVDRVGDRLRVTGRSPDGLVEAIELDVGDVGEAGEVGDPTTEPWMLGVQWHPEETAATDPVQQSLFDALALLGRLRGSRARPGERAARGRAFGIAEHDPTWPARYEAEARRIVGSLPSSVVTRIDHIGSTSVPGLPAKPIVDIQLSLRRLSPRDTYVGPLVELGYRWVIDPWNVDREYFSRDIDGRRAFQVHVCTAGSSWERRHLAFRDRLRAHPEEAAAYADLKRKLAAAHPNDTLSYTEAKSGFIAKILERAEVASVDARHDHHDPGSGD